MRKFFRGVKCFIYDIYGNSLYTRHDNLDDVCAFAKSLLTDREAYIIDLYYGLNNKGLGITYKDIGCIIGISWQRVRQIKAKSLRKLRHPKFKNKILGQHHKT